MSFNPLPEELKILIIEQTLPEGFESLAVTCKSINTLCQPFIEGHNALRKRYRSFEYIMHNPDFGARIMTAVDLIALIVSQPIVARYLHHVDFDRDSVRTIDPDHYSTEERERHLDDVAQMVRSSAALRQAQLDPDLYYTTIEENNLGLRYSQNAAAFLLTLLPNVVTLKLPRRWKPNQASNRLIDTVVYRVQEGRCYGNEPSLCSIQSLANTNRAGDQPAFEMGWVRRLLTLPTVISLRGCFAMGQHATQNSTLYSPQGEKALARGLQTIHLTNSCLDVQAIESLLRSTPNLRTLSYSYSSRPSAAAKTWDICAFVGAISRQVGSHLEELSLSLAKPDLPIHPGRASLKDFHRLRVLELPIELVTCNIQAVAVHESTSRTDQDRPPSNEDRGLMRELVPHSVTHLSIIARGSLVDQHAVSMLFCGYPSNDEKWMRPLTDLHLTCLEEAFIKAEPSYKVMCAELEPRLLECGVRVHLEAKARSVLVQ